MVACLLHCLPFFFFSFVFDGPYSSLFLFCGLFVRSLVQSSWVETVFSLVWAVVSVQHGAASMTECGLIPALLNVVQLNMDGQVRLWLCLDVKGRVSCIVETRCRVIPGVWRSIPLYRWVKTHPRPRELGILSCR